MRNRLFLSQHSALARRLAVPTLLLLLPISVDAQSLYVASTTGKVAVIDMAHNRRTANIAVGKGACCVGVMPDGAKVYVSNTTAPNPRGEEGTVSVINASTNRVVATIDVADPGNIAISPNNKTAFVLSGKSIAVITTATNKVTSHLSIGKVGGMPTDLVITPNGRRLYVTDESYNVALTIDIATHRVTLLPGNANHGVGYTLPIGLAITPNGHTIYVADAGPGGTYSGITTINTANNVVGRISGASWTADEVTFSPNGRTAYISAIGLGDEVVHIIDNVNSLPTISSVFIPMDEGDFPCGVAISPNGAAGYIAENGPRTAILVFDTKTNRVFHRIPVNEGSCISGQAIRLKK